MGCPARTWRNGGGGAGAPCTECGRRAYVLVAYVARTKTLRKVQQQLLIGKLINHVLSRRARRCPWPAARDSKPALKRGKTARRAKRRDLNHGPSLEPNACLRARPMDPLRVIPTSESVGMANICLKPPGVFTWRQRTPACSEHRHATRKDMPPSWIASEPAPATASPDQYVAL